VPLLRRKVDRVVARAGFRQFSHMYKNLLSVLQGYPRDELFQIDEDTLFETALGILRLGDRRKTRVFIRRDLYGRFYSCLVFIPRENFNTDVRLKIMQILKRHLQGTSVEFTVHLSEALLARLHMLVRSDPRQAPKYDIHAIEADIAQAARRWEDDLKLALSDALGEEAATDAMKAYGNAFPAGYRDAVSPRAAVRDIAFIQKLTPAEPYALNLYRPVEATHTRCGCACIARGASVPLSGSLPVLENMGLEVLDEESHEIEREGADRVRARLRPEETRGAIPDVEAIKPLTESGAAQGRARRDRERRLQPPHAARRRGPPTTRWCLRAYAKYLKQAQFTLQPGGTSSRRWPRTRRSRRSWWRFSTRASTRPRDRERDEIQKQAGRATSAAPSTTFSIADEDRILRRYLHLIKATLRTNHWSARQGRRPQALRELQARSRRKCRSCRSRARSSRCGSIRRASRRSTCAAARSPRRAALVRPAGGLPHRDAGPGEGADGEERGHRARGSKGGFVLKSAPPAASARRSSRRQECYRNFLRGLLDITDNLVAGKVVPPRDVLRHDADDPYLVVAADKGTATFSDIANGISARVRLLAGRRVRLRRQRGLRPQEDGHHRAGRVGKREAPLPRDGRGHPVAGFQRGRHRRHVRRRVRQRHAALEAHQARRRVRPSAHLHRSEPGSGALLHGTRAHVQPAAILVGGLRTSRSSRRAEACSRAPRSPSPCQRRRARCWASARPSSRPRRS
jgi:glutamate dehydrogenase